MAVKVTVASGLNYFQFDYLDIYVGVIQQNDRKSGFNKKRGNVTLEVTSSTRACHLKKQFCVIITLIKNTCNRKSLNIFVFEHKHKHAS